MLCEIPEPGRHGTRLPDLPSEVRGHAGQIMLKLLLESIFDPYFLPPRYDALSLIPGAYP
ncbi:hypothetical protein METHB2_670005 [Candidatus Methylobacter favarea]|uniref:Uncharacterized protein n=1 Tax=Candidatus Methylobacter favarea TaxID=2707345 RepID=A0A8S0WRY1_9GAMM|nr:hypothetical protein METHB2_670005 [Candidatus Methylobacter favarea]